MKIDERPVAFVVFPIVPAAVDVVVVFAVIAVVIVTNRPPDENRMSAVPYETALKLSCDAPARSNPYVNRFDAAGEEFW